MKECIIAILSLIFIVKTYGDPAKKLRNSVKSSSEEKIDNTKMDLEKILRTILTMSADFKQTDKFDNQSKGYIIWDRPKRRMKINYTVPNTLVILVKDDKVIHYDRELNEKTESSYYSSPLAFLMDRKVNLDKVVIISDETISGFRHIRLTRKTDEDIGSVELIFTNNLSSLAGWIIYDKKNDLYGTEVSLHNTKYNTAIPPEEFERLSQ